jgi:hypothetical protein
MRAWGLFVSAGHNGEPEHSTSPASSWSSPTAASTTKRSPRCPGAAPTSTTSSAASTTSSDRATPHAAKPDEPMPYSKENR